MRLDVIKLFPTNQNRLDRFSQNYFVAKAQAFSNRAPKGSLPRREIFEQPKKFDIDERSSLFLLSVGGEEKKRFIRRPFVDAELEWNEEDKSLGSKDFEEGDGSSPLSTFGYSY